MNEIVDVVRLAFEETMTFVASSLAGVAGSSVGVALGSSGVAAMPWLEMTVPFKSGVFTVASKRTAFEPPSMHEPSVESDDVLCPPSRARHRRHGIVEETAWTRRAGGCVLPLVRQGFAP